MFRVITAIWFFVIVTAGIRAQEQVDFNTVNMETYRLYQEQQWDSLIVIGKEAMKHDLDYYYLRMRMGIARYHQKNYRKAAGHFTKALTFNPGDPVALEYLYFSRLFSGERNRANLVRREFKGDLALRLPFPKGKFVDRIGVEYLFSRGLNDAVLKDPDELFSGLPIGVQYVNRHFSNVSLSLVNTIAPGISLTHAYTFLAKVNHYYYNDGLNSFNLPDQHVNQHQYHISPHFTISSGFTFRPMFHLLNMHYQVPVDFSQGNQGGASQVTLGYLTENDFVTGLGISKAIGPVDLYLEAYYATLNQAEQVQNRIGVTWFPMGNLNLYAGAYMNTQYEVSSGESVIRLVPELMLGVTILEKVWFDLNATVGEMKNYLENNGLIVYNSYSEVTGKKVKLSISVPVSEKGSLLYCGGRWTSNRSEFYPFDPDQTGEPNTITYNVLSIYGGLSWKF